MKCCTNGFGLSGVVLLVAGAAIGIGAYEGIGHASATQPEQEMQPGEMNQEEMMAEMMRLAQPGEHHQKLEQFVGEWDAQATFMMPGGGSIESGGSLTTEWILGGRYVKGDFHLDDMMGAPFDGVSYIGYDNGAGEYTTIWMDNMSTKINTQTAEFDGDSFIQYGTSGMGGDMKIVSTHSGDDELTDTFYEKDQEGEWYQSGTIVYTRK